MSLWQLVAAESSDSTGGPMRPFCLAVVVATGVLTGALVVGDSVQYTLRRNRFTHAPGSDVEFAVASRTAALLPGRVGR